MVGHRFRKSTGEKEEKGKDEKVKTAEINSAGN